MTYLTKENMQKAHDELLETFVKKNADYGNSFENSLDEYGLLAAIIRMEDKIGRLRTLFKSEAKVKDESISDTLRDLSNYALMAAVWYDQKSKGHYSGIRFFEPGKYTRPIFKDDIRFDSITGLPELKTSIDDKLFRKTPDPLWFSKLYTAIVEGENKGKSLHDRLVEGQISPEQYDRIGTGLTEFDLELLKENNPLPREIEIQNKEQLRLFLNIHKEDGAVGLVKAIGRDLFYKIDFTDFLRYVKELRGVEFKDTDRLEIYFNVRNKDLNGAIYVKTNTLFSKYVFPKTDHFEEALTDFIEFKKFLLHKDKTPNNIKSLIKVNVERQGSTILKPRTRIDDAFMDLILENDEIEYFKDEVVKSERVEKDGETIRHFSSDEELLTRSFIYDMYEGATDPDHGHYHLVFTDGKLTMASSVDASLKTFLSDSFLDSFQRVLDSGLKVKLVNIPQ